MSRLDERLREVVSDLPYPDTAVETIKEIIREEAGIDNVIQDLINLRANMEHDMVRLGITPTPKDKKGERE